MPKIKLTYFDIEGAAEPVRLALALSGVDYEDERIKFPDWKELKPKTPYGQLPLMAVDDGPVKTQSSAMLRWVGAECSTTLYPREKLYEIEEALGVLGDVKRAWEPCLYMGMAPQKFGHPEGFSQTDEGKELVKSMRENFVKNEMAELLGRIEGLIEKSGGGWAVSGDEPTIADCAIVAFLRGFTKGHIDFVDSKCLEVNPKVVQYCKRFCDLPQIKGRYQDGIGSSKY
ncbi:glutathione S-transferase, N-terminal domain containing protein [Nitzschia inconspicua]|uniref:Glutathione S-transferase, N-terminal domain containing protein n=1 Tax=Nitzschia inconspicua TaxID=303405 RepID=A0A9K3LJA2_9STRA|nr:glutathione S-transferase, N-terminal domain containing protein [Nitzschia inconspicua]